MLQLLFSLVFILPASILLGFAILSARWDKVLFLCAGMTLLTTWSLFSDGRDSRLPIMPIVAALQFGLMVVAIAIGLVIRMARHLLADRRRGAIMTEPPAAGFPWPDLVFGSVLAIFIPTLSAYEGAFSRADGEALFVRLGIVIVVAIVATAALWRAKSYTFAATTGAFALALAALASYALSTGTRVQAAAKMHAQGKPYCIQSGNTVVTDVWDLTILNLRAKGGSNGYLNYHALLVVQENGANQLYNWSYSRSQFQLVQMTYKPDLICTPRLTP